MFSISTKLVMLIACNNFNETLKEEISCASKVVDAVASIALIIFAVCYAQNTAWQMATLGMGCACAAVPINALLSCAVKKYERYLGEAALARTPVRLCDDCVCDRCLGVRSDVNNNLSGYVNNQRIAYHIGEE